MLSQVRLDEALREADAALALACSEACSAGLRSTGAGLLLGAVDWQLAAAARARIRAEFVFLIGGISRVR
jgi:hypothetical protein